MLFRSHEKIKKYATEDVELDEATPPKGTDVADKSYLKTAGKKPGPLHNVGKGLKAFLQGKKEPMESVELDGEIIGEQEASTDMLRGRVHTDNPEANAHKSSKIKLHKSDREVPRHTVKDPIETRARKSIETHGGIATVQDNLDLKYGKPSPQQHVTTEAKDPETSDAFGGQANFATNGNTSSDEPKKKVSEA